MSIALYMDENVHRAVTNGLRLRGIDVLTVQEDKRIGFPDPKNCRYVISTRCLHFKYFLNFLQRIIGTVFILFFS
jgi:hypothetical protein